MPYNPGVSDISGQLFAQGMSHGINSLVQGYNEKVRKEEEDKDLLARARATASFIKTHPDLFGGEDEVKRLTSDDPNMSPRQQYFRNAEMMQNTLTGQKIQGEQAQMAAHKAQMDLDNAKLAAFSEEQQLQKAARERMQGLNQFDLSSNAAQPGQAAAQMGPAGAELSQFSPDDTRSYGATMGPGSIGNAASVQQQPSNLAGLGVYSPQVQAMNNAVLYGSPTGSPGGEPTIGSRGLDLFRVTGHVPTNAEAMQDEARMTKIQAGADNAETRATARKAIADAQREIDRLKLEAKGAKPVVSDIPGTESKTVTQNGQMQIYHPPVPKDPMEQMVDRMEAAKAFSQDPDENRRLALEEKKKLLKRHEEFAPNQALVFAQMLDNAKNGKPIMQGVNTGDQPTATPKPIVPPPAATSAVRTVRTKAEYDALPPGAQYIGPDGLPAIKGR